MTSAANIKIEHPRYVLNLGAAVLLFVAPWAFGFINQTAAAWTAWVTGGVVAALSVAMLFAEAATGPDLLALVLGIWTLAAPSIVGFTSVPLTMWVYLAVGVVLLSVAAWEVWGDLFPDSLVA